eukprot:1161826-Pelagomonas_calceolata.AAC.3
MESCVQCMCWVLKRGRKGQDVLKQDFKLTMWFQIYPKVRSSCVTRTIAREKGSIGGLAESG